MSASALVLVFSLIHLHGPGGQTVSVNPEKVVSLSSVRPEHQRSFAPGVRCIVRTDDGRHLSVIDDCGVVGHMLKFGRVPKKPTH